MRVKKFSYSLLICLITLTRVNAIADTVSVHFRFNISTLDDAAKLHLDSAIYNRSLSDAHGIQIIGYADEVGGNDYNLNLSRKRAKNVKAYLIESGFREDRITLLTGKGEEAAQAAGPDGNVADRRVDVVTNKSSTEIPQQIVQS